MTEKVLKKVDRSNRPTRIPVHQSRDVMTIKGKDPDFFYRVVKDKPGRVDKFIAGGYEVVTHEVEVGDGSASKDNRDGTPVKINLGRGDQGFLMRIPREFYDEDQRAKQVEVDRSEEELLQRAKQDTYGKLEISRPTKG